jgi:hypothetical protein
LDFPNRRTQTDACDSATPGVLIRSGPGNIYWELEAGWAEGMFHTKEQKEKYLKVFHSATQGSASNPDDRIALRDTIPKIALRNDSAQSLR